MIARLRSIGTGEKERQQRGPVLLDKTTRFFLGGGLGGYLAGGLLW